MKAMKGLVLGTDEELWIIAYRPEVISMFLPLNIVLSNRLCQANLRVVLLY